MNLFAGEIAKRPILIGRASFAEIHQKLQNRALRYASHAAGSTDAIALDKSADDLNSFRLRQLVHGFLRGDRGIMLER